MKNIFLLTIAILLSNNLVSQTLQGKLVDAASKESLIGANIFLKSDFSKGTQSDLEGNFEMNLNKLPDTIWISYIGYQDQWIAVDKNSVGQRQVYEMYTEEMVMDVVTVKATKLVAKEFTVEQIKKLDIWLNPAAKADPLLAVQTMPASTNSDESANISLRGSPPSETGVFLNNVPLRDVVRFDQNNGIGQFSIFNTALMSSVNVFPSNPPLEFGNATAGAVALYTDDDLPDNSNSISLNLVGLSAMTSQQIGDESAFVAYANWNSHHGLKALNPDGLSDLKNFGVLDGGLYGIHRFSPELTLKVFNFSMFENYRFVVRAPSFEGNFQQRKKRNQSVVNLIYRKKNWQWQLNQGLNMSDANYQIGVNDIDVENLDYHTSLTSSYLWEKWSIKTGVSVDAFREESDGVFARYAYAFGEGHPTDTFTYSWNYFLPEWFVYGKYKISDRLTLGTGFRWHPEMDGVGAYESFQVNLAYDLKEEQSVILSMGQYQRYELFDQGDDLLIRVRSRQVAIDYRWKKDNWKGNFAVYTKQNLRDELKNPIYGAEFYLQYQGEKIVGSFSMASISSKNKTEEYSYPTAYDMAYVMRGMLQYKFKRGLTLSAILQMREGPYFRPVVSAFEHPVLQDVFQPIYAPISEGNRFPMYHRLDFSASRMFATTFGTIIAYFNINNVVDQKNARFQNYNQDYSKAYTEYLSRRTFFFGGVFQF